MVLIGPCLKTSLNIVKMDSTERCQSNVTIQIPFIQTILQYYVWCIAVYIGVVILKGILYFYINYIFLRKQYVYSRWDTIMDRYFYFDSYRRDCFSSFRYSMCSRVSNIELIVVMTRCSSTNLKIMQTVRCNCHLHTDLARRCLRVH